MFAVAAISTVKFCAGGAGAVVDASVPEESIERSAVGGGGASGGVNTSPAFATAPNRQVVKIQIATKRLSRIIMFFFPCFGEIAQFGR